MPRTPKRKNPYLPLITWGALASSLWTAFFLVKKWACDVTATATSNGQCAFELPSVVMTLPLLYLMGGARHTIWNLVMKDRQA